MDFNARLRLSWRYRKSAACNCVYIPQDGHELSVRLNSSISAYDRNLASMRTHRCDPHVLEIHQITSKAPSLMVTLLGVTLMLKGPLFISILPLLIVIFEPSILTFELLSLISTPPELIHL